MRRIILVISVILAGACSVKADLVFDSGYNTFDANDPYYDEVWVINDAHLDVLGGEMGKLELTHYATANLYDGEILLRLAIRNNTTASIHGGILPKLGAWDDSLVDLYAYDVTHHPTGGLDNHGWLEGTYYSNDTPFSFSLDTDTTYSHISIVPEPTTFLLFGLGGLLLRNGENLCGILTVKMV